MKQVRYWVLAAVVAVAVLGVGATSSGAPKVGPLEISSCQTITAPGSYILVANLITTGNFCIIITADFVTLNLAGFVITGPGATTPSTGVYAQAGPNGSPKGVKVSDGTVTGFDIAVALGEAGVVERVRVFQNIVGISINNVGGTIRDSVADGNNFGFRPDCPSLLVGNVAVNNGTNAMFGASGCVTANNVGF